MILSISVIIPVFNEVNRVGQTIIRVDEYLKRKNYQYEIIVVNDGSTDGTDGLLKDLKNIIKNLKIIEFSTNQGKGAAIKEGMLLANGEVALFMDADSSTDITEIDKLLPFIMDGYNVVVGSRHIHGAIKKVKQSLIREFLGWLYRLFVRLLIKTDITDTQNGFKVFSRQASKEIFNEIKIKGWGFDVEVFLIAKKMKYRVKEVPIIWVNDKRSKMRLSQMVRMLLDLFLLRKKYSEYI